MIKLKLLKNESFFCFLNHLNKKQKKMIIVVQDLSQKENYNNKLKPVLAKLKNVVIFLGK